MVDRTVYANEAATPKLNLRQIFGRQGFAHGGDVRDARTGSVIGEGDPA